MTPAMLESMSVPATKSVAGAISGSRATAVLAPSDRADPNGSDAHDHHRRGGQYGAAVTSVPPSLLDGLLQVGEAMDVAGGARELVPQNRFRVMGVPFGGLRRGEHRLETVKGTRGLALDRALWHV